jgi:asparagine synthase (glutamine-hydrolysing)
MCGIFAIFESSVENEELRKKALAGSKKLRHRGPDWSGVVIVDNNNAIAHERLAIMDPESGEQPLTSKDGKVVLAANGEIYNYKELRAGLKEPYDFKTGSDCEVLIPLFQQEGIGFLNKLRYVVFFCSK